MNRQLIRRQIFHFFLYAVIQLPLLHRYILFDKAFGFFYLGFLLFFPFSSSPIIRMVIGFAVGLLIDTFSNTPGMHAAASVLLVAIRNNWLVTSNGYPDDKDINIKELGIRGSIIFVFPLVFAHHLMIFTIEHGGLSPFGRLMERIFLSALFSTVTILILNYTTTSRTRGL